MRKLIYLIFIYIFSIASLRATTKIDSLLENFNKLKHYSNIDTVIINKYLEIGQYFIMSNPQKAFRYADTALNLSTTKNFKVGIIKASIIRANYFHSVSQADSVHKICGRIIPLAKSINYYQGLASAYIILGNSYQSTGDNEKALDNYLKSLKLTESIPSCNYITASTYQNIALIHQWKQNYTNALEYAFKAKQQYELNGNYANIGSAISVIGAIYLNIKDYNAAKKYLNLAVEHANKYKTVSVYNSSMSNLSILYANQGNYTKAIEISTELLKHINDPFAFATITVNLASYYGELRDFKNAHKMIKMSIDTCFKYQFLDERQFAFCLLSEIYEAEGKPTLALKYFKMYSALKDSMVNEESLAKINELTVKYGTAKKEQTIKAMDKESKYKDQIRVNMTYSIIGLLIMLGAVAYLFLNKRTLAKALSITNENLHTANIEINEQRLELEVSNTKLEQLNEDKNEFLGIAAHDLKNPLSNISMIAFALKSYFDKFEKEKILKMIDNIDVTSKRMTEIIVNLLDVNAIDSGKIHFDIKPIICNDIIIDLVETHREVAGKKGICLILNIENTSPIINYDERTYREILENLLSNAIKFSPHNTTILFSSKRTDDEGLKITIKDAGPGISYEDKKKLFSKYEKLSAKPTGGEISTGLGLSIAKKLAEMLDSTLECESELGNGSEFSLIIPKHRIINK